MEAVSNTSLTFGLAALFLTACILHYNLTRDTITSADKMNNATGDDANYQPTKDALGSELYQACIQNQRDKVEKLVSERGHKQGDDTLLRSVLDAAVTGDAADVVRFCLDQKVDIEASHNVITRHILVHKSFASYRAVIEAKALDINYYVPWFGDFLSNAAVDNNLAWAAFCLEHGADPNRHLVDDELTVLTATAAEGHREMVELLVRHGAKVKGSGAIVYAAEGGHTEVVKFLLAKGADMNEVGVEHPQDPRTAEDVGSALTKAVASGHVETALYLIREGADTNLKDGAGRTARDLAEQGGHIRLLEEMNKAH